MSDERTVFGVVVGPEAEARLEQEMAAIRRAEHGATIEGRIEALETRLAAVTEAGNGLAGLIRHQPGCPAPYGCTCTALCEALARWNEVTK